MRPPTFTPAQDFFRDDPGADVNELVAEVRPQGVSLRSWSSTDPYAGYESGERDPETRFSPTYNDQSRGNVL